jgi:hypothetical protein
MKDYYAKHNDPSKPSHFNNFSLRNLNSRARKKSQMPKGPGYFFCPKKLEFFAQKPGQQNQELLFESKNIFTASQLHSEFF